MPFPALWLPFAIWLLMGYIGSIPLDLEDAAMIDGCGRLQTLVRIVLPLSRPALVAVAVFSLGRAWSEFLFAYSLISSERLMTVPVGLAQIMFGDVVPWGELTAAAMVMSGPALLLYLTGQRYMVGGLTAGSTKGG